VKYFFTGLYLLIISSYPLYASEVIENINLKQRTDDIKAQVIALNRDLFLLEEDLLHPISTLCSCLINYLNLKRFFTFLFFKFYAHSPFVCSAVGTNATKKSNKLMGSCCDIALV